MRVKLLSLIILALICNTLYSQIVSLRNDWDSAFVCHKNAQGRGFSYDWRKQIASTVKVDLLLRDEFRTSCSATLVNQATPENELRQILILARHCITEAKRRQSIVVSTWPTGLYNLSLIRGGEVVAREKAQIVSP